MNRMYSLYLVQLKNEDQSGRGEGVNLEGKMTMEVGIYNIR